MNVHVTGCRSRDPQAKQVYKLRSYIFCVLCGRRLYGKTKHDRRATTCARRRRRGCPKDTRQSTYWVREDSFLDGAD